MVNNNISCRVTRIKTDEPVIKLNPDIINELNISVDKPVQLRFGNLSISANINQFNPKLRPTEAEIQLSERVLRELHMPANIKLSIKHTGEQELSLGPVIGILTFPNTYAKKLFGFYINYHIMLKNGLLFVFSSQGVNPGTNTIKGYYFNPSVKTRKTHG